MAIPDYQTFMRPVLHLAAEKERTVRECIDLVADKFSLSAEEREVLLPSGKQTTLANRVHWAVTFMAHAGLVQRPRRGVVVATTRGREILKEYPERIDNDVLSQFPEFLEFRERSRAKTPTIGGGAVVPLSADKDTPEERIEAAYEELNSALREDLLARITKSDGDAPAPAQHDPDLEDDDPDAVAAGWERSWSRFGARIVRHGRYVVFQLAEVAVPRALFANILRRIDRLRLRSPPLPA